MKSMISNRQRKLQRMVVSLQDCRIDTWRAEAHPERRGFRLEFSVTNTGAQTPVVLVTTPSCALLVARLAQQAVVTTVAIRSLSKVSGLTTDYVT